jgi:hypothetical protein
MDHRPLAQPKASPPVRAVTCPDEQLPTEPVTAYMTEVTFGEYAYQYLDLVGTLYSDNPAYERK